MSILEGLRPEAALHYFEELCAIPHGSRDTKRISDYCVRFAEKHGLRYVQDAHNNVVIYKDGSAGYENHPTVILQGHLDMVCEKEPDCDIDFSTDGLRLRQDGTYLFAEGTTLGGDDGIAVAYTLAVLASETLAHPPLEAVFTVDEEIGMLGADALDMSLLSGRVMLNIDSEDEGILTAGCAGGATATVTLPVTREAVRQQGWRVRVDGLTGGHSGVEIHKGRVNANKLMAKLLRSLPGLRLARVDGGAKDNAIPRSCEALLVSQAADFAARFETAKADCLAALPATEPHAVITCEKAEVAEVLTADSTAAVLGLLDELPNGVQAMSTDIPGLVQTSLNLGIVKTSAENVAMTFSVRSSVGAEKSALLARLQGLAEKYGAAYGQMGEYPAWEFRKDSRLRETMVQTFEALYGKKPVVDVIHAGLECGIFSDRLHGLDAVSFGPQMHDIHTSRERLELASVARTWDYLVAVLAKL